MQLSSSKLKNLRTERGWSQEHLSEITGLSSRTIQRMENDGNSSPESAMAIASAFGISPVELQSDYDDKIGDGKIKPGGIIGFALLIMIVAFYLNISGDPYAIIDVPAFIYILVVPFSISLLSNGLNPTLQVYKLTLWLIYEQKEKYNVHLYLPVLRKLIIYSYVSGVTGTLFSLMGMLTGSENIYYPAGFSIALLVFIYSTFQSEFVFRPLYHKLNVQLIRIS